MISSFRKPKSRQNLRRRRVDSDEGSDREDHSGPQTDPSPPGNDEDLDTLQSNIAQFKQKREKRNQKRGLGSTRTTPKKPEDPVAGSTLLTFDDPFGDEEESEVFQVKKSSSSRRLIKQKKAEKRRKEKEERDQQLQNQPDRSSQSPVEQPQLQQHQRQANVIEPDLDIKFKDTMAIRKPEQTWTLSGREAEALHLEEEDDEGEEEENDNDENEKDGLHGILKTGAIPDAAAIHAARKRRQAARERGGRASPGDAEAAVNNHGRPEYIPLEMRKAGNGRAKGSRLAHDDDDDKDFSDEERISFTGVKSVARDRALRQKQLQKVEQVVDDDDEDDGPEAWEEMQIRKAMPGAQIDNLPIMTANVEQSNAVSQYGQSQQNGQRDRLAKPSEYNLQGIKGRLKERLSSCQEVHRRHQSDADRAVDDLVESQNEITRLQSEIPDLTKRHAFYQELRGYVTDLVECFNEKIVNIIYLEDKFHKSKAAIASKLMDRRREDVRDQMIELSSTQKTSNNLTIQQQQDEAVSEAARQRRAAERDGRRRRRAQARQKDKRAFVNVTQHMDGMSSDDELSTLEQANLGKARQEVENQARQILSDVVEDFSSIAEVKERFEDWKLEDYESYNDAYVSLCLPKIFSPLVRLQLLFWNPFAEHEIEQMEWFKTLSMFSYADKETLENVQKDPDRFFLSLMIEKVVLPKLSTQIKLIYDPLSTTQTLRVTSLATRLLTNYPTLRGDSKQVREFITITKDRLKSCIDQDPYIPIGYSKQMTDNPSGGHALFAYRQFWSCFKLYKNTLAWHGIIGDGILADLALNCLLNRYLLIALQVNPDPVDAIYEKCILIAKALPSPWREDNGLYHNELSRFAQFLSTLATKGIGRDKIKGVANLLKYIGFVEECKTVERLRL